MPDTRRSTAAGDPVWEALRASETTGFRNFVKFGAGNETRTRDLNLGKVPLYQLSYSRISSAELYVRVL
jgi:hypothetical protein